MGRLKCFRKNGPWGFEERRAAILLQHGHDPRGDLWEPEVLLLILFLGGLVAVVAWLVVRIFPRVSGDERPETPRDSAEETLRERFARGEISPRSSRGPSRSSAA